MKRLALLLPALALAACAVIGSALHDDGAVLTFVNTTQGTETAVVLALTGPPVTLAEVVDQAGTRRAVKCDPITERHVTACHLGDLSPTDHAEVKHGPGLIFASGTWRGPTGGPGPTSWP